MNKRNNLLRWSLGVWMALWLGGSAGRAATVNISIGDNFFNPSSQTINVGDKVIWKNNGFSTHNVVSTGPSSFFTSSGSLSAGLSYTNTFNSPGTFNYTCTFHGGQNGSITVQAANQPPTVSITSPTNNQVFAASATFTVVATNAMDPDGTIQAVIFNTNGVGVDVVMFAPFQKTLSNIPAGNYALTVVAIDNGGLNTTSAVVNIVVNSPPTVSITSPTNNTTILAGANATIQGNATDNGSVVRVDLFASGFLIGSVTTAPFAPFSFTATDTPPGNYILTAVATDNLGASNTSAGVNIQILTNATLVPNFSVPNTVAFTLSNSFVGQTYRIDALTNFNAASFVWFPLATNIAASNDFLFTDTVLTNVIPRLYRVRQTY